MDLPALTEMRKNMWARIGRESFWGFATQIFGIATNPKGDDWLYEPIHRPLCDWWEYHTKKWLYEDRPAGRQRHLAVAIPRECGKTTLITRAGLLWLHLHDPDMSTYIGNEDTQFAREILAPVGLLLKNEGTADRFNWCYGNWYDPARLWKADQFNHAVRKNVTRIDPSFGTWSVGTGLVGRHPDVLCLDDPVSYEILRRKADWLTILQEHIASLVPVLRKNGLFVHVGTRYHDRDQFGFAFKRQGIRSLTGMEIENGRFAPSRGGKWHVFWLAGKDPLKRPVIPKVWSTERMDDFEKIDPVRYAAQVMNDPQASRLQPLTGAQFDRCVITEKDLPKRLRITIHLDTALHDPTAQGLGDETVVCTMGHAMDGSGEVYFLGARHSHLWRVEHLRDHLLMEVQAQRKLGRRVYAITDERLPGGKDTSWEHLLTNWFHDAGMPVPLIVMFNRPRALGSKNARKSTAINYVQEGYVRFLDVAPGLMELREQLVRAFGTDTDDLLDAFSDAFHSDVYQSVHRQHPQTDQGPRRGLNPWDDMLKSTGDGMDNNEWREPIA